MPIFAVQLIQTNLKTLETMATFASRIKTCIEKIEESIDNLNVYLSDSEFFETYGIRFDSRKNLEVGFVFGNSKSNIDREDERDFPEFGTEAYDEMEELDGTCAYFIFSGEDNRMVLSDSDIDFIIPEDIDGIAWYIIATNDGYEHGEDNHEIIMKNATVVARFNFES